MMTAMIKKTLQKNVEYLGRTIAAGNVCSRVTIWFESQSASSTFALWHGCARCKDCCALKNDEVFDVFCYYNFVEKATYQ